MRSVVRRLSTTATDSLRKEGLAALARRVDLKGKTVLVRADLNVPLSKDDSPKCAAPSSRRAFLGSPVATCLCSQGEG